MLGDDAGRRGREQRHRIEQYDPLGRVGLKAVEQFAHARRAEQFGIARRRLSRGQDGEPRQIGGDDAIGEIDRWIEQHVGEARPRSDAELAWHIGAGEIAIDEDNRQILFGGKAQRKVEHREALALVGLGRGNEHTAARGQTGCRTQQLAFDDAEFFGERTGIIVGIDQAMLGEQRAIDGLTYSFGNEAAVRHRHLLALGRRGGGRRCRRGCRRWSGCRGGGLLGNDVLDRRHGFVDDPRGLATRRGGTDTRRRIDDGAIADLARFDPAQLPAKVEGGIGAFEQRALGFAGLHCRAPEGIIGLVIAHQLTVLRWKISTASKSTHITARPPPASAKRLRRWARADFSSSVRISVTEPITGSPDARARRAAVG